MKTRENTCFLSKTALVSPHVLDEKTRKNTCFLSCGPHLGTQILLKWAAWAPLWCPRALQRAPRASKGAQMRAAWAPCGCPRAPTWVPLGLQMAAQAPLRCSNGLLECTLIFQECSKTRKNTCFLSSRPQACVQSHLLASMCCLGAAGMPKGVRMNCSGTTWPPKWLWGTKRSKNTCFYVFSCVECSTSGCPGSPK